MGLMLMARVMHGMLRMVVQELLLLLLLLLFLVVHGLLAMVVPTVVVTRVVIHGRRIVTHFRHTERRQVIGAGGLSRLGGLQEVFQTWR